MANLGRMKQLTCEDKIVQELSEELRKININPNACLFYLTDEGDKIYMIKREDIPKPIKILFER